MFRRTASLADLRSQPFARIVEGERVVLAAGGQLDRKALLRHAVSLADVEEALHVQGLNDVSGARAVLLEPSGKIAAVRR